MQVSLLAGPTELEKVEEYLSIHLENGHLVFMYELGGGPAKALSSVRVDDGKNHTVELRRKGTVDDPSS